MMTWTAEKATQELLEILPFLNRIVVSEVRAAAGDETTMPQFRVMDQLAAQPLTLSALARLRRVSLQAMSVLVQGLVERGWIVRVPDPHDRRQQLLELTALGREHFRRAESSILLRLLPMMEELSEQELHSVALALPALRRVLTQEAGTAESLEELPV